MFPHYCGSLRTVWGKVKGMSNDSVLEKLSVTHNVLPRGGPEKIFLLGARVNNVTPLLVHHFFTNVVVHKYVGVVFS